MQATLFQTAREINLSETLIAINYKGRWEVYEIDADGIEVFSHYATPGESQQFYKTN